MSTGGAALRARKRHAPPSAAEGGARREVATCPLTLALSLSLILTLTLTLSPALTLTASPTPTFTLTLTRWQSARPTTWASGTASGRSAR